MASFMWWDIIWTTGTGCRMSHTASVTPPYRLKTILHSWQYISHITHNTLHISHYIIHTTHYTLHTTKYTLHTTHYTIQTTRCRHLPACCPGLYCGYFWPEGHSDRSALWWWPTGLPLWRWYILINYYKKDILLQENSISWSSLQVYEDSVWVMIAQFRTDP